MRFNRFQGEAGRPFHGRYKTLHVEPGHGLAQVAHYIHLNPVRAKVVTAERLLEFRSSSLPLFAARNRPAELEPRIILPESGGLPDSAAGWRKYIGYLGVISEEEAKLRDEKFGRLSRRWTIGSPEFRAALKKVSRTPAPRTRDSNCWVQTRTLIAKCELWEEKLSQARKAFGAQKTVFSTRKSAPEKVQLAAMMKATTSVSDGWLADRRQMGKSASVSQFVRRFRLSGGTNTRAFRAALSNVTPGPRS